MLTNKDNFNLIVKEIEKIPEIDDSTFVASVLCSWIVYMSDYMKYIELNDDESAIAEMLSVAKEWLNIECENGTICSKKPSEESEEQFPNLRIVRENEEL